LFGQPNEGDDGLFDREGSPFTKKGGLFSGGGGLFDDESQVHLYFYICLQPFAKILSRPSI